MKRIIIIMLASLVLAACTPMDDKYKDFVKDGPVVYIAKLDAENVKVIAGRGNVNIKWPPQPDPRGNLAIIYWANRTQNHEASYDPAKETSIFIRDLEEGSYIFDIMLTDNAGNFSNSISLPGKVYGDIYESYLTNRRILSSSLSGDDRKIIYRENTDNTLVGVEFQWIEADRTQHSAFISPFGEGTNSFAEQGTWFEEYTISDCNSLSFRYRTHYSPEGGEDIFYSPWEYYVENVEKGDVQFDFVTKEIEFPEINDGNFLRFELEWTDRTTGLPGKFVLPEGNLSDVVDVYNGKEFRYYTVYKIDNQEFMSVSTSYATVVPEFPSLPVAAIWSTVLLTGEDLDLITNIYIDGRECTIVSKSETSIKITTPPFTASFTPVAGTFDLTLLYSGGSGLLNAGSITLAEVPLLDRTSWYVAPETDLEGTPIENVNFGSAPPAVSATSPASTIANKLKSPYLSHFLPYSNAAFSTTNGDGVNNPRAHIDNNSSTYLSMVKGLGTDATSGVVHFNGGVVIPEADVNVKPWFIIRLHETTPQKFNYFRIRYREAGGQGNGLKPQGVTLFGSNDDSCITDESKWTKLNNEVIVPASSTVDSSTAAPVGVMAPANNVESGNMIIDNVAVFEYRYVKVQYERWATGSNTMQVGEFWLGLLE